MNYLELSATAFTVICIYLAGRNNIHTWWTGIVACVLLGALFYSVQLYADVLLQVFFTITGIMGWIMWSKRDDQTQRSITKTDYITLFNLSILALIVALAYANILHVYTDAYNPWIDSAVLSFSILGQYLLMGKKREAWPVWVIVNTLAVPLFFSRELYILGTLYAVFWAHAIWVTPQWYRKAVNV